MTLGRFFTSINMIYKIKMFSLIVAVCFVLHTTIKIKPGKTLQLNMNLEIVELKVRWKISFEHYIVFTL